MEQMLHDVCVCRWFDSSPIVICHLLVFLFGDDTSRRIKMAEILEDPVKLTDDLDVLALPNPDSNDLLVRDDQAQDDTPNLEGDKERGEDIDIRGLEDFIARSKPQTELEKALFSLLDNKNALIHKMSGELQKLQAFVVKRKKQVYKRKRKDADHPVKPLSAYNIFLYVGSYLEKQSAID